MVNNPATHFQNLVYSEQADIVWVTETWLRDDIENSEILPWNDYTIYRKDRQTRAGGVLALKSSSFSSSREIVNDSDLELVAVELKTTCKQKYLACYLYKPPQNMNRQWLDEFNLFLANKCSDYTNILICGDFNFPKICWESPEFTVGVDEVQFTELLNDHYLTQVNQIPTRGDHILDLVISSVPENVQNMSVFSPSQCGLVTDHSVIMFDIATPFKERQKIKRTVFDYNRGNFDELRATLETVDLYGTVKSAVDINHGWLNWKEQFLSAVCGSIPRKTISNVNNPPWINGEIIHAIGKKETVRRKLKTTPTDILKDKFKALRPKVKRMITESLGQFFENISEALSNNPKRFWSVFKISSKRASVPGIMTIGSDGLDSNPVSFCFLCS